MEKGKNKRLKTERKHMKLQRLYVFCCPFTFETFYLNYLFHNVYILYIYLITYLLFYHIWNLNYHCVWIVLYKYTFALPINTCELCTCGYFCFHCVCVCVTMAACGSSPQAHSMAGFWASDGLLISSESLLGVAGRELLGLREEDRVSDQHRVSCMKVLRCVCGEVCVPVIVCVCVSCTSGWGSTLHLNERRRPSVWRSCWSQQRFPPLLRHPEMKTWRTKTQKLIVVKVKLCHAILYMINL